MKYIVCYDITNNKGRRIIEKNIKDFGIRFQYSVFICDLPRELYYDMIKKIKQVTKKYEKLYIKTDSILIIPICEQCYEKSIFILKKYSNKRTVIV